MNEVLNAIARRSSTRSYTEEALTEEEIKILATAGLQAPTARNAQEVHISVLDGSHPVLQEIEQEKRRLIAQGVDEARRQEIMNQKNNFYYSAPTVFMLSVDKDFSWGPLDAGICAENICLAAESLGLGSLIIGIIKSAMSGEKQAYFAKRCCFPENSQFAICVAVGHKNAEKQPHTINYERGVTNVKTIHDIL